MTIFLVTLVTLVTLIAFIVGFVLGRARSRDRHVHSWEVRSATYHAPLKAFEARGVPIALADEILYGVTVISEMCTCGAVRTRKQLGKADIPGWEAS